jgi:glycosyltransferase involved in cell wall biosynthesis
MKLSQQLGVSPSVNFMGHVEDVRKRLQAVDIFVLPSRVEGNSNAVLEAMDAGLPIVATPVGGTPMQVGAEGASLLFGVGDVDALVERLLMLIHDSRLRRHYGYAMRQRSTEYFDIDKVAGSYNNAYSMLAECTQVDLSSCSKLPDQYL